MARHTAGHAPWWQRSVHLCSPQDSTLSQVPPQGAAASSQLSPLYATCTQPSRPRLHAAGRNPKP